jgi:hypothetical protein
MMTNMNKSKQQSFAQQVYEISKRDPGPLGWLAGFGLSIILTFAAIPICVRFPGLAASLFFLVVLGATVLVFQSLRDFNSLLRLISPLQNEADYYRRAYEKEQEFSDEIKAKRDSWRKIVLGAVDNPGDEDIPADLIASLPGENRALKEAIEYLRSERKFDDKDGDNGDDINT